ncbi:MAG: pirin family protein [Polyangiaceae bacterium]|nr:pirin family protein [Polyangiaceae bacterium]
MAAVTHTSASEAPASAATPQARRVAEILRAPGLHWVGDGFRVRGYFNLRRGLAHRLSPFLLLDYHPPYEYPPTTSTRRGVGPHPHRGFETVTIAFAGSVAHHDTTGAGGVIGPGDVQWMTAASGVLHREYHEAEFARRGGTFHMAQLWVNLPREHKMGPPAYQGLRSDSIAAVELPESGGQVRVIAGEYRGAAGAARTFTRVHLFEVRLAPTGRFDFALAASDNLAVLVMSGSVRFGESAAAEGDFVLLENSGDHLSLVATSDAHLLVLGGAPIDEPIAQYGPFVMNDEHEIVQAARDYERGAFGHLED